MGIMFVLSLTYSCTPDAIIEQSREHATDGENNNDHFDPDA